MRTLIAIVLAACTLAWAGGSPDSLLEGQFENFLRMESFSDEEIETFMALGRELVVNWETGTMHPDTSFVKIAPNIKSAILWFQRGNTLKGLVLYDNNRRSKK